MIIGIAGHAQHGKDTVGDYLVDSFGFRKFAFADNIKRAVLVVDPFVGPSGVRLSKLVEHGGWEHAKRLPEVRRLLQVFGTEAGREIFGENVWVDLLFREIDRSECEDVVITDVRLPNEVREVHHRNGVVWRVKRLGALPLGVNADHTTEKFIDVLNADHIFVTRTVHELHELVEQHMRRQHMRSRQ